MKLFIVSFRRPVGYIANQWNGLLVKSLDFNIDEMTDCYEVVGVGTRLFFHPNDLIPVKGTLLEKLYAI